MNGDESLPEEWATHSLTEVAEVILGQSPPGSTYNTDGIGLPFFQGKTEFGEDHPKAVKWCSAPTRIAEPGDILMSVRAPVGPTNVADQRCAIGRGLAIIRPRHGVPASLVRHAIRLQEAEIASWGTGTTFTAITKGHFKDILISLPPEPQRVALAELLDQMVMLRRRSIGHMATGRRAVIRFRQAVLAAACAGRLTADWRESNAPDESADELFAAIQNARRQRLGHRFKPQSPPTIDDELPDRWAWTTVGALVDVATGATPLRRRADYYSGSIPWVTSGAVNAGLVTEASEYITDLAVRETNAKVFPAGTLLVAMYGEGQTRGRVAELGIAAATNQAVAALVFDDSNEFLRDYLRTFFLENYERIRLLSFGGVQPNLSLGVIRDTLIPLPPIDEQVEIVRRVDQLTELATSLRTRIDAATRRVDGSSLAILAKAFRGELTIASETHR